MSGACDRLWNVLQGKAEGDSATETATETPLMHVYKCALAYEDSFPVVLRLGYFLLYVTMQAFAIPGTGVLTQLAGALYPFTYAILWVNFCATLGAAASFQVSAHLGGSLIRGLGLHNKVRQFRDDLSNSSTSTADVFKFMVLSRVTPIPNVVINIASPHLQVPFQTFAVSTLFGLLPLNSLHVMSGAMIAKLGRIEVGKEKLLILGLGTLVMVAMVYRFRAAQASRQKALAAE